jgi:catechol 2,3-dioxygenase-like lactoylglutathione lyase family enzyme
MRFINPLVLSTDVAAATAFYRDAMGLAVVEDHGNFVMFEGGFALHDRDAWFGYTFDAIPPEEHEPPHGVPLYFVSDDLDKDFARLASVASIVHPIKTEFWGQRVFRFRDPDGHLVEIGDPQ